MTNSRFTYRTTGQPGIVDVYLRATDTYLGALALGRGTYHLHDAEGNYLGESAISRDTAAGSLYAAACDAERRRLTPERNLDGDLADRPVECIAAELAGNVGGITCACPVCEAK
jgi:hypothetical protein